MSQIAQVQESSRREFLQRYGLILSFLLLCIVLALLSDRFLTVGNATNILRQSTINGIIAVGMTVVILTAGIDLSVGSILALSSVITASMLQSGLPVPAAILIGLGIGATCGLFNGIVISRAGVPPFVATLGMMTIARGLALVFTEGKPITGLPDAFRFVGTGSIGPIPTPIVIAAATFIVGYILLTRTSLGQFIYGIGNNPVAARYAGISVSLNITLVYMMSGLLSALAGLILIARLDSAQPTAGIAFEFDAIAAVVVGGTSFAGGQGGLGGTLIGVLIIAVLNNGLNLLNISSFYQPVVSGVVIALALLLHRAVGRT
ncbi:MAG TPA: ribose ABC transporter permease [Anaerolineae bacterium]|jgi:ribose/xylose/arabinose/galactoside ABC-type transport system permease subunit|nr:ribose ABC transporter permease [Anaerolineae bacterium]